MVPNTLLKCDNVKTLTGFDSPILLHIHPMLEWTGNGVLTRN